MTSPSERGFASLHCFSNRRASKQGPGAQMDPGWHGTCLSVPQEDIEGHIVLLGERCQPLAYGFAPTAQRKEHHMSQVSPTLQALRTEDVMTHNPVTMDITGTVQDAADLMCAAE